MRKRLLECAMVVFAQGGITSSLVQDIVTMAGVSPGSFYHYFNTNEDLFHALAEELSNEIVGMIASVVEGVDDPALRMAMAIRSYLHLMRSYQVVAQFVANSGFRLVNNTSIAYDYLPRDLRAAQKQGSFDTGPINVAVDLIGGAGLMAIYRMAYGKTPKNYPEQVTGLILRSLGSSAADTAELLKVPLPKLTALPDSLFVLAQARLVASGAE